MQLKSKQAGKLVMYGDDTWLKLFPGLFSRADGTSSFFVSVSGSSSMYLIIKLNTSNQDFTEVDNNVTRHIPQELKQSDWNGMILHFLGLDHIGHKSGPKRYNVNNSYFSRELTACQSSHAPKTTGNGQHCKKHIPGYHNGTTSPFHAFRSLR